MLFTMVAPASVLVAPRVPSSARQLLVRLVDRRALAGGLVDRHWVVMHFVHVSKDASPTQTLYMISLVSCSMKEATTSLPTSCPANSLHYLICLSCPVGKALVDAGTGADKHDVPSDCKVCLAGTYAAVEG